MMPANQATDGRLRSWKRWSILATAAVLTLAVLVAAWQSGVLCLWLVPHAGYLDVTTVESTPEHLSLRLVLLESKVPVQLEKISIPRSLQSALGIQSPPGFVVEERFQPPGAPEGEEIVHAYNTQVHFVGKLIVRPDTPVELRLPIRPTRRERGRVDFMYRGSTPIGRTCSSWTFVTVEIGGAVEQSVAPDEAQS